MFRPALIAALLFVSCAHVEQPTQELTRDGYVVHGAVLFIQDTPPSPDALYACGSVGGRFQCIDFAVLKRLREDRAAGSAAGGEGFTDDTSAPNSGSYGGTIAL